MENKRWWVIYFAGKGAVKAGYNYQNGRCYRPIFRGEEFVGQLEVVRDDEDAQLVAVFYIPEDSVDFVKAELAKSGFDGMQYEAVSYGDKDCIEDERGEKSGYMPVCADFMCGERKILPEPVVAKSVITIFATVREEQGEWLERWIDCEDPEVLLPHEDAQCEKYLRKFDIILVGDKWFAGIDAHNAMAECYRQYKKVTILNDEDETIAEIYDTTLLHYCTEDYCRYRWASQTYGNVERSFADVLEVAQDGETYKHSWKGW